MLASDEKQPMLCFAGALHIDEVATVKGKFVPAASNPVIWQRFVGGVGANAARAARTILDKKAAGSSVSFHAAIGDDSSGQTLQNRMRAEGLQTEPQLVKTQSTGRYSVVVDESGQLILGLADVQLAEHLRPEPILPAISPALTNTLVLDTNLSPACIGVLIEAASSSIITLAALTVSPSKAVRLLPWADKISLLFCNRREALALATESKLVPENTPVDHLSLQQLADALVVIGFNDFVLTDAASPLLIRCKGVFTWIKIPPIKVDHNVNGAGDTLAGASIAALTTGLPLEQAVTQFGLTLAADVLAGRRLPLALIQ